MTRVQRTSLVVGALAILLAACGDRDEFRPPRAGDPAPEYAAATLGGDTIALEDLRGSPVLLNIWATWCVPCREEMPGLQALHQELGDQGLHIIGVSIDGRNADEEVRAFVERYGITFTILHDPGERASRAFRTVGVPETFLIDREGAIVHRWVGLFDPTMPENRARIADVIDSQDPRQATAGL